MFNSIESTIWIDAEVHLFPPEWCVKGYRPPATESVMIEKFWDHPEGELALSRASEEGLLSEMERCGIDGAVIMGLPWKSAEMCEANNAYIAQVAASNPGKFYGLGVTSASGASVLVNEIARIQEVHGLLGVKVIPQWQNFRLNDQDFQPVLKELTRRRMILFPHTDHFYLSPANSDTPAALFEVAQRFPDLKLLAPHLGGLICLYAAYQPLRKTFDNILFIGTVPNTMQMIKWAVDAVGVEKVAFGTDFPFNPSHDQSTVKNKFMELGFDKKAIDRIAGRNVLDFLGVNK